MGASHLDQFFCERAMSRSYGSFLVRCWRLDGDEQRIEVEHIQTGERRLATTVAEAIDWICSHSDESKPEQPVSTPIFTGS